MELQVIIAIIVVLAVAYALTRKRKDKKPEQSQHPDLVQPVSQPVLPISQPEPPTYPPTVPGVDLRARRPDPEFSPVEPFGAYYGEGPFDPFARYIDLHGLVHNP